MTFRWNPKVLEEHFAPGIGSFTCASIPDLRAEFAEADHWVANHFLNTVTRGAFKPPHKQYALNFLFRTRVAFRAYHAARDATLDYLKAGSPQTPKTRVYCDAVASWETFLLNWAVCVRIVNAMSGGRVFVPDDGSSEERAYAISNKVKHWAEGTEFDTGDTLPTWLTNDGLSSKTAEVSYEELADLARDLARLADEVQDPVGMKQSAETALGGESPTGTA